eukprot:9352179-Pyramimonas_sp.AAC.1
MVQDVSSRVLAEKKCTRPSDAKKGAQGRANAPSLDPHRPPEREPQGNPGKGQPFPALPPLPSS